MGRPLPTPAPEPDVVGPHGIPFPTLPPRGGARYKITERRLYTRPTESPRATNGPGSPPSGGAE